MLFSALHHTPDLDTKTLSTLTGFSEKSIKKIKQSIQQNTPEDILENIKTLFFPTKELSRETIEELKMIIADNT